MKKLIKKTPKKSNNKQLITSLKPSEKGTELKAILREISQPRILTTENQYGDETITLYKQEIQQLLKNKELSEKMGDILLGFIENHEQMILLSKTRSTKEDYENWAQLTQQSIEQLPKQMNAVRQLFDVLNINSKTDETYPLFKKNVDYKGGKIGLTKAIGDRLTYLPELLENAKLAETPTGNFIIRSELENQEKTIGTIGLEYSLQTKDENIAKQDFETYKKNMHCDALNVFLAYWATANDEGCWHYLAPLTNIMKHTIENEKRYPSSNEKKRFWELSLLLANTKLTLKVKLGKTFIKITHPLLKLEMTSGKTSEQEENKGYPDKVFTRVLDPNTFKQAATLATEISRSTIKGRGEDTMLSLIFQIKTSQNRDRTEPFKYDELDLIKKAGLIGTYNSNRTVARKRLKKKLDAAKEAEAIEKWESNKSKTFIYPKKAKKNKTPKQPKISN